MSYPFILPATLTEEWAYATLGAWEELEAPARAGGVRLTIPAAVEVAVLVLEGRVPVG